MPEEGRICDGPEEPQPPGDVETLWWEWKAASGACGVCKARDGKLSPVVLSKPHARCRCDQYLRPRSCQVGPSTSDSSTERVETFAGIVPAHGSRTFSKGESSSSSGSASMGGVTVGGSSGSSSSDSTTINNDSDETLEVFEVWETTTEVRVDTYYCGLIVMTPEYVTVTCTETVFLGFESH